MLELITWLEAQIVDGEGMVTRAQLARSPAATDAARMYVSTLQKVLNKTRLLEAANASSPVD